MKRINISISESALKELDNLSSQLNLTRSKFIINLIELYKSNLEKKKKEEERKKKIIEAIKIQDKLSSISCNWDGVSEIRKWREFKK